MSLLSPSELAEIRSLAQSGMAGAATILVRSTIETENGTESVWATSGDDVACWVYELTGNGAELRGISGAVAIPENFSIRVPIGTEVAGGDRIAVGSRMYDVQNTNAQDTYGVWLNCICRIVE